MAIDNPLSKALRRELHVSLHAAAQAEESALIAKAAGLPVDEQLDRAVHLKEAIKALLSIYDQDKIEHNGSK